MRNFKTACECCGGDTVDVVKEINISRLFRDIQNYTRRLADIIDDARSLGRRGAGSPSDKHRYAINLDQELKRLFAHYSGEKV